MIIKKMTGIHWTSNKDGAAYYEDENGNDWYEFRNSLSSDKPIIVVKSDTRSVLMHWIGDPSFVGLPAHETIDVYQLDEFPAKNVNDLERKSFTFSEAGEIEEIKLALKIRTKEDIAADLRRLQEELAGM